MTKGIGPSLTHESKSGKVPSSLISSRSPHGRDQGLHSRSPQNHEEEAETFGITHKRLVGCRRDC